jgi:hypothetical protein
MSGVELCVFGSLLGRSNCVGFLVAEKQRLTDSGFKWTFLGTSLSLSYQSNLLCPPFECFSLPFT